MALGPLTNLALAFGADPELPGKLREMARRQKNHFATKKNRIAFELKSAR